MTYKEYCSKTRKIKADQKSLDEQYIREYPHRDLFGKNVIVRFFFRGKVQKVKGYYEGLERWWNDVIPVFKYIREDGKPSMKKIANIYSMKQIVDITEINTEEHGRSNQRNQADESCSG